MIENFSLNKVKLLASFILFFIAITCAQASHLRAGQITIVRNSCTSREVLITITVYTNTASVVKFGEDGILDFGDGTNMIVPGIDNVPQPQLGTNIGIATFTVRHTYAGVGSYLISYVEPNRNGGVLNMSDSFFTTFYLETLFDLAALGCNNSPQLRIPPIDQACTGVAFYHNPGAFDINPVGAADSLSYELVVPFRDRGTPVNGYISPENMSDESELGGSPTFTINPIDGTMVWDAPSRPGEYNVAFNVVEWRNTGGIWKRIGYVRRDMQIIVNGDCENERPILETPADTCVVAGANIHKTIRGEDQVSGGNPPDPIKIQAFSQIFEFPPSKSPATRTPVLRDGNVDFQPSPASIEFDWNTTCDHIRGQPYDVVFKISDFRGTGPSLVTFKTWKIKVVAPPPVLNTTTVQIPERYVKLDWTNYDCSSVANVNTKMQIWRRVDETSYMPGICETGMPESLGFTLIAIVPLTDIQYTDTNGGAGLERGVKYCYRLVAIFPDRGAESPVSNEVCIDPIDIAAPLITRVTVDKTGESDGEITVRWIPPLNPQFPLADYQYVLQRVNGSGFTDLTPKLDMTGSALSFVDDGLNTFSTQYSYRVMLYVDGNPNPVDSSSIASSVWLALTTSNKVINLNWRATVPWSNQIEGAAFKHLVYFGEQGATTLADLTSRPPLEIDVTTEGLKYSDTGLDSTKTYCYAVVTRGSYGNDDPLILAEEPLENTSQINCATPTIVEPPCAPVIAAFADPCKDYFSLYSCTASVFSTVVRWSMPENCASRISRFEVWQASTSNVAPDDYDLVAVVQAPDTFAVINNLASLAYCYRIKAIDRSGNASSFSARVCSENCPYYELPNVFTPNGDKCNDYFSAFGVEFESPEDPDGAAGNCATPTAPDYVQKCARFVDRIDFKVFNRWGREVYDYIGQRGNENSIYINWDGRDKSGKELATGIYFYSADVTFSSTAPGGKSVKTFKGWVHLMR